MLNCQTSAAKRSNSGTYYYNARWYDAGTGRFISEDPARDGSNWYIYTS
ncbi:RHS repeat-associated core domain-containing protein, partial [Oceanispirochaeta sp.]